MAGPAAPAYVQTAVGPAYTRDGKAFVRDKTGAIKTVDAADVGRLLDEDANYQTVSAEDVAKRDVEIAHSSLGEKAKTFAESAAAGAVDVPLIPVRLGLRAGQSAAQAALGGERPKGVIDPDKLTGRAFVEGVAHDYGDASKTRDESQQADIDARYREESQARRETNSGTALAGQLAGQLPYAFAGPSAALGEAASGLGVGARLAAQGVGGALEGAGFGESQATDDAYIENKPLTAEKLMASMGWGALIGGVASVGLGAGSEAYSAGRGALKRAVSREAVSDEAAAAFTKRPTTAAAADPTDARIASAADSAGANPAARREAAQQEARKVVETAKAADPTDWRNFTKQATPEAQYLHRETVLNAASNETAQDLTNVLDRQRPIYDEIDDLQAKRSKIAEHLAADNVDETAVIGRAQQETADLRSRIAAMREDVQARQAALAPETPSGPLPKGKRGAAAPKMSSAEKALQEMDVIAADHEGRILGADAGADAVAEFDSMRRQLSRVWRTARGGNQAGAYEARTLMEPVAEFAKGEYNRAAQTLMDESFVGAKQAAAQKAVNNARVGAINGETFDLRPFVQRVGGDAGADFGGQVYVGNQDSIRGMLSELGPGGGGMRADQFSRFLDSQQKVFSAIKENYALSPGSATKLDELLASVDKMRGSVRAANDAATAVNRAKAAIEADQIGGGYLGKLVGSTLVGGIQGGVSGAAKGFARGALGGAGATLRLQENLATLASSEESRLAAWLEQKISKVSGTAGKGAAVVNRTASNVDSRVASAMDGFFGRIEQRAKQAAGAAEKPIAMARAAAAPTALKMFTEGDRPEDAYRKRTEQLLVMNQNLGQGVRDRTTQALGGLSETAPRLTQHVAVAASRATNYLIAHAPVPLRQPSVMQPGYRPVPSDLQIAEFAKRWAAVADPMTVLDDFEKGMVTYEQVDALKNVYPQLFRGIQVQALQRFQRLDAAGVPVPYQDRLQADLMFDLHGAGDPTLDAGFAIRVSGMQQAARQQQGKPHPRSKPLNVAKSYASESQAIGASLRGVTT